MNLQECNVNFLSQIYIIHLNETPIYKELEYRQELTVFCKYRVKLPIGIGKLDL